jgi:hypothetical protein
MIFPPLTVPLTVILFGWLLTLVGPFSPKKTLNKLGYDDNSQKFLRNSVISLVFIQVIFILPQTGIVSETGPSGLFGLIISLVMLPVLVFGLHQIFHLPYRCLRLLLVHPQGKYYSIGVLSPTLFLLIVGGLEIPIFTSNSTAPPPGSPIETVTYVIFTSLLYLVMIGAVVWKENEIRMLANSSESVESDNETPNKNPSPSAD